MEYDDLIEKLKTWDGKRITEKQLRDLFALNDYEEHCNMVFELVKDNHITPVKSSGPNGMNPTLYRRYTVTKEKVDNSELLDVIRLLSNNLNIEGYLTNSGKYLEHQPYIDILDNFLKNKSKKLSVPLSINERSFQIFHQEKAIKEDNNLIAVLNFNKGLREALNFYFTPEPFFTHTIMWNVEQLNILIIENKDTWYTLKSIMSYEQNKIAGVHFNILLYGEGKKISRKIDTLTEFSNSFYKGIKTRYYYFGDLDYEGIGIFYDLINVNPSLNIKLMIELYSYMIEEAKGIQLPDTKENQNEKVLDEFIYLFDNNKQKEIVSVLQSRKYIPQEILNREDFILMINDK